MDTPMDIQRQKYLEWLENCKMAMRDECEKCELHDESCFYYDEEEESYDWEQCFKDREW